MKRLLIVGAGEYGHVVRELAFQVGYDEVEFLDDNSSEAICRIEDFGRVTSEFDEFIVAIGNPIVRRRCVELLKDSFDLATIIHPLAYVSKEAVIGAGCVIEPGCVVYRKVNLGDACLVNAGAVLNHDCIVGDYCQIGCNAVVTARTVVSSDTKLEHGSVTE